MTIADTKFKKSRPAAASVATGEQRVGRNESREALNMRVRPEVRSLIDHAASLTGKNRTDFVLDAARQAAQNAILDQTVISLNAKSYAAFVALLDARPKANERLRATMKTKPVWE
jgi:uncharacterized protein (DUF1778 family)